MLAQVSANLSRKCTSSFVNSPKESPEKSQYTKSDLPVTNNSVLDKISVHIMDESIHRSNSTDSSDTFIYPGDTAAVAENRINYFNFSKESPTSSIASAIPQTISGTRLRRSPKTASTVESNLSSVEERSTTP